MHTKQQQKQLVHKNVTPNRNHKNNEDDHNSIFEQVSI